MSSSRHYKTANGAVISNSDSTRRALDFGDDKTTSSTNTWSAPKIYPSFNSTNLRRINAILNQRRQSKSKSKSKPVQPPKPLPTITKLPSVRVTERFNKSIYNISSVVYRPTLPFVNPNQEEPKRKKGKAKQRRHERKKSVFIDDSAIESDGDGNDIPSTQSTPERCSELKFVNCGLCGLEVSSEIQLKKHRGSKKCRKLQDQGKTIKCNTCNKIFVSTHDLHRHKLAKNH